MCEVGIQFYSFVYGYSVFPAPFAEETFPPNCLDMLVKNQLTVNASVYLWTLISTPLIRMSVYDSTVLRQLL